LAIRAGADYGETVAGECRGVRKIMKRETSRTRAGEGGAGEGAASEPADAGQKNSLQTLDRGLQVLLMISQSRDGLSIADLAARLGVHRAICYRLVGTLEARGFVARRADGRFHLGAELLSLAARFEPRLRAVAGPLIRELAQETRAAAFVSVPQGDQCVAIMVAESDAPLLRLSYRVGSRHPLSLGAAGIAILAGRPESAADTDEVREARRLGYSLTRDQLQRGAVGVAAPVHAAGLDLGFEASIGVVALDGLDVAAATRGVVACAARVVDDLLAPSSPE